MTRNIRTSRVRTTTVIAMLAMCGAAAPAFAQNSRTQHDQRQTMRDTNAQHRDADTNTQAHKHAQLLHFVRASTLLGQELVNANGETIGSVDDLVVERGTGRITHAIIRDGGFLGIGGDLVVLPIPALHYEATEGRFASSLSEEQITPTADMIPDDLDDDDDLDVDLSWVNAVNSHYERTGASKMWQRNNRNAQDPRENRPNERHRGWAYDTLSDGRDSQKIEGTIRSIGRETLGDDDQQFIVATVTTDAKNENGNTRANDNTMKVVLGPSWYVMGRESAPMRGERITAQVVRDNDAAQGNRRYIATNASVNGREMALRNDRGQGRWVVDTTAATTRDSNAGRRYMLMSHLIDADAATRDSDAGEIEDAVIETFSNRVAMLVLDPDENFLGIADELKVVPWELASVRNEDTIAIDADVDMLAEADALPEDLTVYVDSPDRIAMIYTVYRVDPSPMYGKDNANDTDRDSDRRSHRDAADTWTLDNRTIQAFADGEDVTINGTVVSVVDRRVAGFDGRASVLTVRTDEDLELVILGPASDMSNSVTPKLDKGDKVEISAKKAKIDGAEQVMAFSIRNGDRNTPLWRDGRPLWLARK